MSIRRGTQSQSPVALVTGGAKRVGRAIVLRLAQAGLDVAIHHRTSKTEAEQTSGELATIGRRAAVIQADLAEPSAWQQVVQETVDTMGRLDVLVNNASIFPAGPDPLGTVDAAAWEATHRVNALAPVGLCHEARRFLAAGQPGRVINLLDIAVNQPWSGHEAYCASKATLANATKTLARAWAPDVLVNGIAPGIAVFPDNYSDALRQRLIDRVPMARAGTPEEIAEAVAFLATSATYMTGQMIAVDGGRSLV